MTGLEILLAVAGTGVTVMVVVAMILITPRGGVEIGEREPESQGTDLSPTRGRDRAGRMPVAR